METTAKGVLAALLAASFSWGCSVGEGAGGGSSSAANFQAKPISGDAPLRVDFTPPAAGTAQTYAWDFGDGSPLSNASNPSHLYIDPGVYDVKLVLQGPGGQQQLDRFGLVEVQARPPFTSERVSTFGADTPGGSGGVKIHVINLDPSGPGSLLAAIQTKGPRIVVFDVAGVIDLDLTRLRVQEPFLTIEGDSGPAPGITLIRGGLSIRTNDVIVRHLRVRPGDAGQQPGSGWEPDGIAAYGSAAHDILVENCSITWAVDENVSASGDSPPVDSASRVTFRNCIIAEALNDSTHAKGPHSRGALMRGFEIAVEGCLFAHNHRRNPVFRDGATGMIVNNVIYDPGSAAIHFDGCRVSVVGNLLIHGPDTRAGLAMIQGPGEAYLEDNFALGMTGSLEKVAELGEFLSLTLRPYWRPAPYFAQPSGTLESFVQQNAGAWPWNRDTIDQRILRELRTRTGGIIDSQSAVGGYPGSSSTSGG